MLQMFLDQACVCVCLCVYTGSMAYKFISSRPTFHAKQMLKECGQTTAFAKIWRVRYVSL